MSELTLYGLPMWRLDGPGMPAPVPTPPSNATTTVLDPLVGLTKEQALDIATKGKADEEVVMTAIANPATKAPLNVPVAKGVPDSWALADDTAPRIARTYKGPP